MDIKNEIDKRYDTPLDELDIDGYINWVLNSKAITRPEKKSNAMRLVEYKEKNITTYRRAIKEVFYDTQYWKEATEQDKDNFPFWREDSLKQETKRFEWLNEGNALPLKEVVRLEHLRIQDQTNNFHYDQLLNLYDRQLTKDFYELAILSGKIDYLHWLNELPTKTECNGKYFADIKNDDISNIIFPKALLKFTEMEKVLFDEFYINKDIKWIRTKESLADFVNELIIKKYTKGISRTKVRKFFQKKYSVIFEQQFKPANLGARDKREFKFKMPLL